MPAKISNWVIRRSTDRDIRAIHKWLSDDAQSGVENFLCNWDLTKKSHKEGKLIVYVDSKSDTAVAYQCGSLCCPGILDVRHDMGRKGIGRKLVEYRIAEAYANDECFLHIQCTPATSIPFWQRMGFSLMEPGNRNQFAYRILEKKHTVPANAETVEVAIRFFPEDRKRDKKIPAYSISTPHAVQTSDGVVHLNERVSFFNLLLPDSRDPVVEIEVAGQLRYLDKAKYPEARQIGVKRCHNGFFIDQLFPDKK
jgi:GNAT superfamily N-acetyltransferase